MKIMPMVSRGEAFYLNGEFHLLSMQVFRVKGGGMVLRLGENVFFFDEMGRCQGTESRLGVALDSALVEKATAAYAAGDDNLGQAPESGYFPEVSPEGQAERSGWPRKPSGD